MIVDDAQMNDYCLRYENSKEELELYWDKMIYYPDKVDIAIAATIGTLSFVINSVFVGSLSLEDANKWGTEEINKFVVSVANNDGYNGKDLKGAIAFLEKIHPMASDSLSGELGGGKQHHLRDFNHHCSIGGLICSLYTQFTGKVIGTDVDGSLIIKCLQTSNNIGKTIAEKIYLGVVEWALHLVSDMAGSSAAIGKGTGIPGPIMSLLKGLSTAFPKKETGDISVSKMVSKIYNGTFFAKRDEAGKIIKGGEVPFDLRTELGCFNHLAKQTLTVMINKIIVVAFCTLRNIHRLFIEQKINSIAELFAFEGEIIPQKAVADMLTLSLAIFNGMDIVKSAVKAIKYSKGTTIYSRIITFAIGYALNKNFVADMQLIAAIITDIKTNTRVREEQFWRDATLEKDATDYFVPHFDPEQTRIIESVIKCLVVQDILCETNEKIKERKQVWLQKWESETLPMHCIENNYYYDLIELKEILFSLSQKESFRTILILILSEIFYYYPYYPLNGFDPNIKTDKYILQKYFCDLFQENGFLIECCRTFQSNQKKAEQILTPEYTDEYREQCNQKAVDTANKLHVPIKSALVVLTANPALLLVNKKNCQKIAVRLSEKHVYHIRKSLYMEEKMFYQACIKQMVLINALTPEEAEIIKNQVIMLKEIINAELHNCSSSKSTNRAELFLGYLERFES